MFLIARKPFLEFSKFLKQILLELSIFLVHLTFIFLVIFENNNDVRIYLECFAFFFIFQCITVELLFSLYQGISSLISIIHNFCSNKYIPPRNKLLSYKELKEHKGCLQKLRVKNIAPKAKIRKDNQGSNKTNKNNESPIIKNIEINDNNNNE